jgi:hypothetical protein
MTGQLLVMAKRPIPGRVKTRLCPPCTPHQASELAAAALADTLEAMRQTPAERRVLAIDDASGLTATGFDVLPQRGRGLGDRIAHAFLDTAATCHSPILQLGMDTPQINHRLLTTCLHQLHRDDVDAVLGPALDGGWWTLGLRDPHHAGVLRQVPMSTPRTGQLTAAALRALGLRVALLPVQRDVDTAADLPAVAQAAPRSRFAAAVNTLQPQPANEVSA